MRVHTLKRQQIIAQPRAEVFRFFESPENLEKITPGKVGFRILTPRPIKMKVGTVLDYTIRLLGISVRWTTLISDYDPPDRFADVALKSPYSFWHHTHTFEDHPGGGTVMTDEVRYALPFGLMGSIVHTLWVKRQLKQIFDFRADVIRKLLERDNTIQPSQSDSENIPQHNQS